jgi:crotonobetainyl-CoA:carnitine CoA-transferase CaiB-like acyl-CoA transferase
LGGVVAQLGGQLPEQLLSGKALRDAARRISRANELNPDPNTSLVVATAASLGLAARARCGLGQAIYVDMFGANAYANFDDFFDYPGKPPRSNVDGQGFGKSEYCRLYRTADGWILLSVDADSFGACKRAIGALAGVDEADPGRAFLRLESAAWVSGLRTLGFNCVRADGSMPAESIASAGLVVDARSTEWGVYKRHAPLLSFDGVSSYGGWCALGEHTEALLRELKAVRY